MRIGELARAAGVVISTARFYERHGVFAATSRSRDGAEYDAHALLRLRFALRARGTGVSMKSVVAAVRALDLPTSRQREALAPVIAEIDLLATQLARLRKVLENVDAETVAEVRDTFRFLQDRR